MTIINIVIICVNTIEGLVEEEYFTHVMPINYVLILCDTQKNYFVKFPYFYPFWSMHETTFIYGQSSLTMDQNG